MRLICPNCAAQYEVDARVIPEDGRDVQCSNCGQAWFQLPEGAEDLDEPAGELPFGDFEDDPEYLGTEIPPLDTPMMTAAGITATEAAAAEDDLPDDLRHELDEIERSFGAAGGPGDDHAPAAETGADSIADSIADQPEPLPGASADSLPAALAIGAALNSAQPAPRRRKLDDAVAQILREESEREVRARRAQKETLESQPELGLDLTPAPRPPRASELPPRSPAPIQPAAGGISFAPPAPTADALEEDLDDGLNEGRPLLPGPARSADLSGEDPELEAELAAANRPPRRELFPDIDMINSTLRATSERGDEPSAIDAPETIRRRRSGFRTGFSVMLLMALLLLAFYTFAPLLALRYPQSAPFVTAALNQMDAARLWLDALATRVLNGN